MAQPAAYKIDRNPLEICLNIGIAYPFVVVARTGVLSARARNEIACCRISGARSARAIARDKIEEPGSGTNLLAAAIQ